MTLRRSCIRVLCRAGAAALVAGGAAVAGAPAAGATEEETPVVSLDPPDAEMFLVPTENYAGWFGSTAAASAGEGGASVSVAEAAALAPPEIAEAIGAESVRVASHNGNGEVDVEYGGTVVVRLPALVDASAVEVSLDVFDAADWEADPRHYSTDPAAVDPLAVADLGGNEFEVTLPADDSTYGPEAYLTFDGLTATDPGITEVYPLDYYLEFTGTGVSAVTLEPGVGVFTGASCGSASRSPAECPATEVRAGHSFDLTVPPTSLLRRLDFGRLDTAEVALGSNSSSSDDYYYSGDDAGLLTRHGADSASVNLPAAMGAGPYLGVVMEGDPFSGGYAMTMFQVDVAAVPLNAGLRSDTGWVDDVRDASAGSTKVIAGTTILVVAGLITVVALAPRRRPPAEG